MAACFGFISNFVAKFLKRNKLSAALVPRCFFNSKSIHFENRRMEEFLKIRSAHPVESFDAVHAVLGNEACDLDSAVSAVVYAYYLHTSGKVPRTTLCIPILNINRADYRLRTDVTFLFEKNNIKDSLLTFRDDVNLSELHMKNKLQLTLVDFNVFPSRDESLDGAVVEVIDHRIQQRPANERIKITIEPVGSCASLIAHILLLAQDFHIPEVAANLLFGAIMIDTVCLSDSAGRKTPKDELVSSKLRSIHPGLDQHKIFEQIQRAKLDISGLSTLELLHKDLKVISTNANGQHSTLSIAISAIVQDMLEFLERPKLRLDLLDFGKQQRSDVIVLMFLRVNEKKDLSRQMIVFSQHDRLRSEAEAMGFNITSLFRGFELEHWLAKILRPSSHLGEIWSLLVDSQGVLVRYIKYLLKQVTLGELVSNADPLTVFLKYTKAYITAEELKGEPATPERIDRLASEIAKETVEHASLNPLKNLAVYDNIDFQLTISNFTRSLLTRCFTIIVQSTDQSVVDDAVILLKVLERTAKDLTEVILYSIKNGFVSLLPAIVGGFKNTFLPSIFSKVERSIESDFEELLKLKRLAPISKPLESKLVCRRTKRKVEENADEDKSKRAKPN